MFYNNGTVRGKKKKNYKSFLRVRSSVLSARLNSERLRKYEDTAELKSEQTANGVIILRTSVINTVYF